VGNTRGQDVVEGRNPVGRHKQEAVAIQSVDVPHLPTGVQFEVREVGAQQDGIK